MRSIYSLVQDAEFLCDESNIVTLRLKLTDEECVQIGSNGELALAQWLNTQHCIQDVFYTLYIIGTQKVSNGYLVRLRPVTLCDL